MHPAGNCVNIILVCFPFDWHLLQAEYVKLVHVTGIIGMHCPLTQLYPDGHGTVVLHNIGAELHAPDEQPYVQDSFNFPVTVEELHE